jgi:ADP-ribosyl-[dinitrogen reductase] hydrolase
MPSLLDRYRGSLLGLACGDAVGTTAEFCSRGTFPPVTDMVGGGVFELEPGEWTDDTSMALCLAQSFLHQRGHDPGDQLRRYINWWQHGYMSSNGECFDIGSTVSAALRVHLLNGNLVAETADPMMAGNGSIMRLAPAVMWAFPDVDAAVEVAAASSITTHAAAEAIDCCRLLAVILSNAFSGLPRDALLTGAVAYLAEPKVIALAAGDVASKSESEIRGSGYSVESLEAALWAVVTTENYRDAVLRAVALGDDADTTAAIAGQIAGALYGVEDIPVDWRRKLAQGELIEELAARFFRERPAAVSNSLKGEGHGLDASE